ncbi:ubiquitin carboxyl-terminal hydrolase 12 [Phtheirospermum japonicum]|uniref:Ubiquitin carboxyl-terminal hydrolase 12 n=1 Tax=Phtheirospermum japonicum TaxID=374723 RepID=A0A830CYZ2_9LAMI|nr:ubiquitin carboxyl-terminal hydrolase 12 [Phtheirospermum japonicum]
MLYRKLIIYPNGQGDSLGYVSVYLEIVDISALPANWEANVVFSICLFNQISCNYIYSLGRTRRFLKMKTEWGFPKFISKKCLMDPSNGYLVDDKCVFGAEVFVHENKAVTDFLNVKDMTYSPRKLELKVPSFSELKDLRVSDEFTAGGRKWNIKVYTTGRWLSVYLSYAASNNDAPREGVRARFSICVKSQTSDKH